LLWRFSGERPRFLSREPARTRLGDELFWLAPLAHAGYLWILSVGGNLRRFSPGANRLTLVQNLGVDYGRHPVGFVREQDGGRWLLAVVGVRRLALLDPAAHVAEADEPRYGPPLPDGEAFVRLDDGFPSVTVYQGAVACLKRTGSTRSLVLWKRGEEYRAWPVADAPLCGPFIAGRRLLICSREALWLLDGDRMAPHPLPADFRPVVDPGEDAPFLLPWGSAPYVPTGDGAYLPGQRKGEPGFAYLEFSGREPKFTFVAVGPDICYRVDSRRRLVLTSRGNLQQVERSVTCPAVPDPDSQIAPLPAIAESAMQAAFCRPSGLASLQLRLYPDGSERVDLDPQAQVLDLFLFPYHLTMTAMLKRRLEIFTWPLV
jgi:hypothetical protein